MKTFCDLLYDRKIKFGIFLLWCSKQIFSSSFIINDMINNQNYKRYTFIWIIKLFQSVAMRFLIDIQDESITDDVLQSIVIMCQYMHSSVIEASDLYLKVK